MKVLNCKTQSTMLKIYCIYYLILLPSISHARIKLNITTAATLKESSVTFSGDDRKVVTDLEVGLFNLTTDNIKYGIRVELGRFPENVFMKDPTKYDNLYEKFHWQPVTRRMRIEKAEILDIIDEPIVIKAHEVINNTSGKLITKIVLHDTVEHTAYSTWSEHGYPNDEIEYDVSIYFKSVQTSFTYTNKWRNSTYRNTYVKFGVNRPGYVVVDPGDSVKTTLKALKSIMLVEVTYTANMIGCFLADFEELEGIHYHFWSPSVFNILTAAGIYKEIKSKELIEIRFFADPQLLLTRKGVKKAIKVVTPAATPFGKKRVNG